MIMEEPKEDDSEGEESTETDQQEFNRDEFSIELEETEDGKQTFYVKSEKFFQKIDDAIKNAINYFKFKLKKIFSKDYQEERQYKLSIKTYRQNKKLEKQLKQLEKTMEKTHELANQIKDDTSKIVLKVDWVVILIERQMANIKDVESYMKDKLGSDWSQLKNSWQEYKNGDISRGEFTKGALKKLGKKFLGIFIHTS
jgi:hypothetical protein